MAELNEVVADEILEQAEGVAKVVRSMNQIKLAYAGIGVAIGAAAGATLAWWITCKKYDEKYDQLLSDEIDQMRLHYAAKTEAAVERAAKVRPLDEQVEQLGYRVGEKVYHPDDVEKITPALGDDQEQISVAPVPKPEILVEVAPSRENVFERAAKTAWVDHWDYAEEIRSRDPGVPYVIHKDEFEAAEKGYTQSTLTYYEDDDVLAGERDDVIEDQDDTIGCQNLGKFGHGSEDPNIVYVRNDLRQLDVEICRSSGSYAEEVHGFQHSDEPRRRRPSWDG